MRLIVALFTMLLLSTSSRADSNADTVLTPGYADFEKVTDFLVITSSKRYRIFVPKQVASGDVFGYQYDEGGTRKNGTFSVTYITFRGDLCWLHSNYPTPQSASHANTIYVQPCRVLR
jgi:hypothetical protein